MGAPLAGLMVTSIAAPVVVNAGAPRDAATHLHEATAQVGLLLVVDRMEPTPQ